MDKNFNNLTGALAPCIWVLVVLTVLFMPGLSLPITLGIAAALLGIAWLVTVMKRSPCDGDDRFNGDAPQWKRPASGFDASDATKHQEGRTGRPAAIGNGNSAAIKPLPNRLTNNRNAATLAVTALLLLIFGLLGPFMDVTKLGDRDRFSLLAGIVRMVEDGHFMLGGVIFVFSAVFPLAKLSLILAATSSLAPLTPRARHRLHQMAELTAKYSLLDVVVIALLIVVLKVDGLAEVKPGWGTFCFLAAALTSMSAGLCVDAKQWEH